MINISSSLELKKRLEDNREPILLYFYTPLCGTCQVASTFLNILAKVDHMPTIASLDLNFFKQEAKEWEIESVPCLIYFDNGRIKDKLYAFESVTNLYSFIEKNKGA